MLQHSTDANEEQKLIIHFENSPQSCKKLRLVKPDINRLCYKLTFHFFAFSYIAIHVPAVKWSVSSFLLTPRFQRPRTTHNPAPQYSHIHHGLSNFPPRDKDRVSETDTRLRYGPDLGPFSPNREAGIAATGRDSWPGKPVGPTSKAKKGATLQRRKVHQHLPRFRDVPRGLSRAPAHCASLAEPEPSPRLPDPAPRPAVAVANSSKVAQVQLAARGSSFAGTWRRSRPILEPCSETWLDTEPVNNEVKVKEATISLLLVDARSTGRGSTRKRDSRALRVASVECSSKKLAILFN